MNSPPGVKLFAGIIYSPLADIEKVTDALVRLYGETDFVSGALEFNHTAYYCEEMGEGLKKIFLSFRENTCPGGLAGIKQETVELEKKFSKRGRRLVNIDPGYMEPAKVVLASTKNFAHRIYIGSGIYAEITLGWRGGGFMTFEWTFPDYRTPEYTRILEDIRKVYMEQRKSRGTP